MTQVAPLPRCPALPQEALGTSSWASQHRSQALSGQHTQPMDPSLYTQTAAMAGDAFLATLGSGEASLPLDPLVVDPAAYLPPGPVIGLPGDDGNGGGVPPLPAIAPAGLGMLESSLAAAARGRTPSQLWTLGPAAAAAPPLVVGGGAYAFGGASLPLGASPFGTSGPAAAAVQHRMPAAVLPAGGSGGGVAVQSLTAAAAAWPWAPAPAALPTACASAAGAAVQPVAGPAAASAMPPLASQQQQQQQAPPQAPQQQEQPEAPQQATQPRGGGSRSRSCGRGGGGGGSRRGRSKAADSDSDYEAESLPASEEEEAGDESEDERAAIEARKKERLRAKNRRAQARYRLKQKVGACLSGSMFDGPSCGEQQAAEEGAQ